MRKLFLLTALVAAMTISAKDIWTGNQLVEWGDGILINADEFTSAEVGQKIVLHYTGASDGVEFKVRTDGTPMLPGSLKNAWISGNGTYELYLNPGSVVNLKAHGLQIIGAHFTATKVELGDGDGIADVVTLWKGLFLVDETWDRNMLFHATIRDAVNWNDYNAIRVYTDAGRSNFEVNFKKSWYNEDHIGGIDDMTPGEGYVELPLTPARCSLLSSIDNELIVQFNRGGGDNFNATDIVLVPNSGPATAISNTEAPLKASKRLVNGQVVIIRDNKTYNVLGAEL